MSLDNTEVARVEEKKISDNNYEISFSRISLVYVISLIIKKGLEILKIDCPENM